LFVTFLYACQQNTSTDPTDMGKMDNLESAFDSVSYSMGLNFAFQMQQMGMDTIVWDAFFAGMKDILGSRELIIDMETSNAFITAHFENMNKVKAEANLAVSKKWLEENAKKEGVIELPSGLQYKVIKEGTGPKPTLNDNVKVHYVGTLPDGSTFDSSRDRGVPAEFGLNGVIRAWTEGLQLMSEGSTYMIYASPDLAYGPGGPGGGGSVLIFEVELLEVLKNEL